MKGMCSEPVQGRNINDVQHFSYSELKQLTNNFSNELFIQKTKFGRLFAAKIQNDSKIQDLVVKTWDFSFPHKVVYIGHPARLHVCLLLWFAFSSLFCISIVPLSSDC